MPGMLGLSPEVHAHVPTPLAISVNVTVISPIIWATWPITVRALATSLKKNALSPCLLNDLMTPVYPVALNLVEPSSSYNRNVMFLPKSYLANGQR